MLRERLISALILVAALVFCFSLDYFYPLLGIGGLWLAPILLFFTFGTASEFANLLQQSGRLVRARLAIGGAVITAVSAAVPLLWPLVGAVYPADCPVGKLGWVGIGAIIGIAAALGYEMRAYGAVSKGGIERIASAALVTTYVGIPMAFLAAIRNLGIDANWGLAAIVTFIAVTKSSDTGAYFVGRAIGRHKMVPLLSPGKTWEGALGGIVFSVAVSFLCLEFVFPLFCDGEIDIPLWGPVLLGCACAVAGTYGDLAESYMKRDSGVKDSGGLLPGMGGVWDVTDSLIGAAIPAFLCFSAGAAGSVT